VSRGSSSGREREGSAIDIFNLLDELESLTSSSRAIWATDKRLVNEEKLFMLTNQLRTSLPAELENARSIVRKAEQIVANAESEAERKTTEAREQVERMLTEARATADQLVSEHEVTLAAQRHANEIIAEAKGEGQQIRGGADAYALEVLSKLESMTTRIAAAIETGRSQLTGTG